MFFGGCYINQKAFLWVSWYMICLNEKQTLTTSNNKKANIQKPPMFFLPKQLPGTEPLAMQSSLFLGQSDKSTWGSRGRRFGPRAVLVFFPGIIPPKGLCRMGFVLALAWACLGPIDPFFVSMEISGRILLFGQALLIWNHIKVQHFLQ